MTELPKILIVDDNETGRYPLAHRLRKAGYDVHEVGTGTECLQFVSQNHPDIILLDIKLPDISGIEVCRRIKDNPQTASIGVIQTSALLTAAGDQIAGLESGADAYLISPFDPRMVQAHVQALLRARRAEQAAELQRRRLEAVLEALPAGVGIADKTGKILHFNAALTRIWGKPPIPNSSGDYAGWIGRWADTGKRLSAEDWAMTRALKTGESVQGDVVEIDKFDGTGTAVILNAAAPVRDEQGRIVGGVVAEVDITAQKKAESALRAARDTFMKLVQNSPFGVYIVDADFKLVQVSNGARKVFEKVTPLLERDFAEVMRCIWQEPFASEVIQRFRHTLETGETYHSRSTVEPRQDVPRIEAYDWKIERIMLPEGKWGVVCHFYDLSERQQFEAALRESEARFRNMADHAPVVIWVTNEHHDCIFLSKSWHDMTGMAPDSGLGWRWLDAIHSDDRSGVEKGFKDACRDKTGFCCEYRLQDGHGGYRWVIDSAQIRKGEGNLFLGYIGSVTDITERKKIEIELAETRERLEAALAAGDVATWVWNVAANRIYSDRNLRAMFGIRADAAQGAPLEEYLQAVHPEDQDLVRAKIQEAMTTGRYYECIYRVAPQAGQIRWVLARAQIERDSRGKAVRMPGVVMDVSRQKEAEIELQKARAELRQYADNLEHLVRSRTARLQELVAELEHFSYTITHDMRAPLRAMRGFAEILQEMLHDAPQPEIHTFLRRIMTSAERMDLLITDALNYGKAVRQDLPLFPVRLQDLIEGMLDTYPEFQADRADIVIHGQIPPVMGNEAGLTQCFSNLIGNAVKFVEAGKKPHVQIGAAVIAYPEGNYVRISVEDKGIGIPEKMLPRVFDMFARDTNTYEGTGIGLALVRKVVQRMNGRVGVESGLGKGSHFWVELQAA